MNGFNPDVKVSLYGDSQFVDKETTQPTPEVETTAQKLERLSPAERQELLEDALEQYSDLESLIHAITALDETSQPTLF